MNFFQRRQTRVKNRWLNRLGKKEERLLAPDSPSFVARKAQQLTAPAKEKVLEKIPPKALEQSANLLEKAFEKSFDLVWEKGSSLIGKLCSAEKRLNRYEQFAQKPLSSWELSRLGCEVALRASATMAFSSVQGGVMGALGIGLPDVPIFLAAVFKTLFEISLSFGYPYDTPPEKVYQLLLICAAVASDEEERRRAGQDADCAAVQIRLGLLPAVTVEEAKSRASKALCSAALAGKMVQGMPIVGVYGGFRNGALLKQIGSLAAVKYQQRMLREMLIEG